MGVSSRYGCIFPLWVCLHVMGVSSRYGCVFTLWACLHVMGVSSRYGCVFTCLTSRAIHIEVAHTLDTSSFIEAFHKCICRRGKPILIRSDNGSNIVGAEKELREAIHKWNQQKIHESLRQKEVEWKFNPPYASHMGGVWERQIRTIRKIILALMKQQALDDEGLATLMCQVEAIVNNRPIT